MLKCPCCGYPDESALSLHRERERVIQFLEKIAGMAARFQTVGRVGSPHLHRMSVLESTIREFIEAIRALSRAKGGE